MVCDLACASSCFHHHRIGNRRPDTGSVLLYANSVVYIILCNSIIKSNTMYKYGGSFHYLFDFSTVTFPYRLSPQLAVADFNQYICLERRPSLAHHHHHQLRPRLCARPIRIPGSRVVKMNEVFGTDHYFRINLS